MFRNRGAVVLVVVGALVVGACSGTDWKAAHTPKPQSAAQLRAAAAAQRRAEIPYINALVASDAANEPASSPVNLADSRCISAAIVHGFGVKAFKSHGLTPNGLRDPNSSLDALPTPTLAQADAIGAALQRCRLSTFGQLLSTQFGSTDAGTATCLTRALTRPEARRFLVLWVLGRSRVDLGSARRIVGAISGCVDLAALLARGILPHADASFHECVVSALHSANGALQDFVAYSISKADPDRLQEAKDALGVAINGCRPGAQTGFTVPPS